MSKRGNVIKTRHAFIEAVGTKEPKQDRFPAIMGDGEGAVKVPGYPRVVYVRVPGRGVLRALNLHIASRNNLPVIVGYSHEKPDTLQVLDVDESHIADLGDRSYLPLHHAAHELGNWRGGDDVVWADKQQVTPLLALPTNPPSMCVNIYSDLYPVGTGWAFFDAQVSASLAPWRPALINRWQARFLLISIDTATNNLAYTPGALFTFVPPPPNIYTNIPACPTGHVPIVAVYLTPITYSVQLDNLYDVRMFNQPMGGTVTPAAHPLLTTATHNDTAIATPPAQGSLVVADATPLWNELAIGAANFILQSDGADPSWVDPAVTVPIPPAAQGQAIVADAVPAWTATLTPTWGGTHTWDSGFDILPTDASGQNLGDATHRWNLDTQVVRFGGASTDNYIVVPDNVASALSLQDDGGTEYLEVISTDADSYLEFPTQGGGYVEIGPGTGVDPDYIMRLYHNYAGRTYCEISNSQSSGLAGFEATNDQDSATFEVRGSTYATHANYAVVRAGTSLDGLTLITEGVGDPITFRPWDILALTVAQGVLTVASAHDLDPADASGQDLGDATHLWDLYTQDVIFGGASGANVITVPDNVADALGLLDAGGLEFLRVVSTNASPYCAIDPAAGGINFGIGVLPSYKLHVSSTGVTQCALVSDATGTMRFFVGATQISQFLWQNNETRFQASQATGIITFYTNGALRTSIDAAGGVTIAGLSGGGNQDVGADNNGLLYVPFVSDAKFKENVESIKDALATVCNLRGISFDWNEDEIAKIGLDFTGSGRQVGLIAQEVEPYIPLAVREAKGYKSLDIKKIIPYLIEAFKEMDTRLTELEGVA
jgi:hypothetical protein